MALISALLPVLLLSGTARPLYRPSQRDLVAAYRRADSLGRENAARVAILRLEPNWLDGGSALWYRRDGLEGRREFVRVDTRTGAKTPLFDHARLAASLGKETGKTVAPDQLPFRILRLVGKTAMRFEVEDQGWELDLDTYALRKVDREARRNDPGRRGGWNQPLWPPSRDAVRSPDGTWTARIEGHDVVLKRGDGGETPLTEDGKESSYYARLRWSGDSKRLVAIRVNPGDRKRVHLLRSAPADGGPTEHSSHIYDRPGDRVDTFDVVVLDPASPQAANPAVDTVDYGGMPFFRATKDGTRLRYDKMDRGYGRWRVMSLDPAAAKVETLVDDDPATFVDSTSQFTEFLTRTDEIVYSSERDGWHHLYLADGKGGSTQITRGEWVVRGVTRVDETNRQITFTASGRNLAEDPYFVHSYRVDFDGRNLTELTPAKGTHTVAFSPDQTVYVDTYSTVEQPPVHELRRSTDGGLIATLERADVSQLVKSGWKAPQPFVAKGRDGKTDIHGLVFRPSHFDPKLRYPVVEDIYAGPQDSFVPKTFSPSSSMQALAELGFIVVKIDGMGTRNRSKAFHDVCYRNLADAGFPDRILWMKALAKVEPSADLERVGVYGTSAGGQNAGGAVLFHPDFYKVAVASCGCHDNRLDKIWWNEQWMGTMGPHYAANSNLDNAGRLRGALMLIVGEVDSNVPPESTYRFGAALQAAGKEYELVVIPNADHTSGGPYGERKRRDFLVRHLLGVEPPSVNR